jgi:hypothetical protein
MEKAKEIEEGRTSDSRVLYLGIGGTGKEIVARVKARLKALGGGVVSPKVGFLVIDVDPSPPKTPDLQSILSPVEMCHPAQVHLPSYVQKEVRRHVEEGAQLRWVGERIPPGEMILEYNNFIRGTERYRQAGLLAYLWEENSSGVSVPLRAAITRVTEGASGSISLHVFLVCSICGGTGSGMLIDAAYLARSIGLDHSAASCDVSAAIVLPGVFRRVVGDATYNDLQRNASAVLTELDYFMYSKDQRISRTCNPNDVDWPLRSAAQAGLLLDTQGAVFQSVFLIDNQRNNGGSLKGTEVVFPAVAEMLEYMSGALIGDRFLEALNNAKSTLNRRLPPDRLGEDMPHFSSLGLARIVLPVQRMAIEAAAVLSSGILVKLQGGTEIPVEAALADAVQSLGLESGKIDHALGLGKAEFGASLAVAIGLRSPGGKGRRIAPVSERVAEILRQKAPPDALRSYCLDALEKAKGAVIMAQDQAQRDLSGRLAGSAESIHKALNDRFRQMREGGRGLVWFSKLLDEVIKVADKNHRDAEHASARDRSDAAVRTEQEFQKVTTRLGSCQPGGVRQAAQLAARKCDDWVSKRVDLVAAQIRERILDDSLSRLRKIAEATQSLAAFLADTLPGETDRVVTALCKKEQDEAPVTDIHVMADGRKDYESAKNATVREKMIADCLKSMIFELREGDLCLSCAEEQQKDKAILIGASLQPFEAARNWVGYLASRLKPHFASHSLDDYILTDEAASRYASACAKEAEAFIKYNPTVLQSEAGDPISIVVVAAPAGSRLYAAFSRDQLQGVVCAQDKDPTTAIVFKAEIGILGKVLQFRKEAAALDASMVSMRGLWTLGQVSHDIFWRDSVRWGNLRLFFLSLAAGRIRREQAPMQIKTTGRLRYEYWLDIGLGQRPRLGLGLQAAILEFLNPNNDANRRNLLRDLNVAEIRGQAMAALPTVRREYAALAQTPEEVPAAPLREVLRLFFAFLESDEAAGPPEKTETPAPGKSKSGKTDTAAG